MKRRKWWLWGFSLALLVAAVVLWNWSEPPPYSFMQGCKLSFVELASDGSASLTYFTAAPLAEMRIMAMAELKIAPKFSYSKSMLFDIGPRQSLSLADVDMYKEVTPQFVEMSNYPPVPVAHGTIISIVREPTARDRLRAWLHGLRWRGSR